MPCLQAGREYVIKYSSRFVPSSRDDYFIKNFFKINNINNLKKKLYKYCANLNNLSK